MSGAQLGAGGMKQEKVIQILEYHRDAERTIRLNRGIIADLENQHYHSVGAARIDGLPKGKGDKPSTVETVALNVPASVSSTIRTLEEQNAQIERVRAEIMKELNALPYRHKAVVYGFYIRGDQWERISGQINYSVRQCKNIRTDALGKLGRRFSANRTIAAYRFPKN